MKTFHHHHPDVRPICYPGVDQQPILSEVLVRNRRHGNDGTVHLTADQALQISSFNRGAESITGVPFRSAVGRQLNEVLQLPGPVMESIQADLRVKRARRHEFRYRTDDGRELEIGLTAAHL